MRPSLTRLYARNRMFGSFSVWDTNDTHGRVGGESRRDGREGRRLEGGEAGHARGENRTERRAHHRGGGEAGGSVGPPPVKRARGGRALIGSRRIQVQIRSAPKKRVLRPGGYATCRGNQQNGEKVGDAGIRAAGRFSTGFINRNMNFVNGNTRLRRTNFDADNHPDKYN